MTDLSRILPDFPVAPYARLIPSIEKNQLTVTDLLTLEVTEIGKRTQLPLLDLKRLCNAILNALHRDLGVASVPGADNVINAQDGSKDGNLSNQTAGRLPQSTAASLRQTGPDLLARPWRTISTLDPSLDVALGGGVPTGYITEITGESGAGKTQFLLTLLLSVQLPPPHGLGRPALYISTEAALSTKRLSQILAQNPFFRNNNHDSKGQDESKPEGDRVPRPSLDDVFSTVTPDLESQDHILTYQVPVEVARRNIGLIVLDSVAANYRAEFERGGAGGGSSSNMAARSAELVRLGHLLRDLARRHNLAVVVANQVADRFSSSSSLPNHASSAAAAKYSVAGSSSIKPSQHQHLYHPIMSQESPLASRSRNIPALAENPSDSPSRSSNNNLADIMVRSSMPEPPPEDAPSSAQASLPALSLDHQQRWFTGWGDDIEDHQHLKTPSLGLVWSTQIAARIALFRRPAYGRKQVVEDGGRVADDDYDDYEDASSGVGLPYIKSWRRWMKVVFAPHVPGTGPGLDGAVEFEVVVGGIRGVERKKDKRKKEKAV
ncbi:DNA repair protein RAD57 [Xylariaceae sp. FL0255]|nr:DNA repair protein RAD57 [Xylariaceae sp. FL0255]